MNLILLNDQSCKQTLEANDRRAEHIRKVLKKSGETTFYVGLEGGTLGKAKTEVHNNNSVSLIINWDVDQTLNSPSYPLLLLVGMCRPQTCRKILKEAAPLGIEKILFFTSSKSEAGYASSSLWKTNEWKRLLLEGVEQSFSTHIPTVELYSNLKTVFEKENLKSQMLVALDNYESTICLSDLEKRNDYTQKIVVAVGSERGWSNDERDLLRSNNFVLASMGKKVFRTETAVVSAISVISSKNNWFQ